MLCIILMCSILMCSVLMVIKQKYYQLKFVGR